MAEGNAKPREMLDVPLVAPLDRRLANLTRVKPAIGPAPRSAVLGKLAAFLPQLAQENEKLKEQMQGRPQIDFDIEQVDEDGESPYIEMDLTCGVLDLQDEAALRAAERVMAGQEPLLASGVGAESSDDDSSDDDDDDESSGSGSGDSEGSDGMDAFEQQGLGAFHRAAGEGEGPGPGSPSQDLLQPNGENLDEDATAPDRMDCGDTPVGQAAMRAHGVKGRRAGLGPKGKVLGAALPTGQVASAGRRKMVAKRSKFIVELS